MKAYRGNTAENTEKKYQSLYFFGRSALKVGGSTQSLKRNKPKLLAAPPVSSSLLPNMSFFGATGMKPTLRHRERHPEVCSMIAYRVSERQQKAGGLWGATSLSG